jgi:integrase
MAKINLRSIDAHMSYTILELSQELEVDPKTIRRWIDVGMSTVPGSKKPILVVGIQVKEFVLANGQKEKLHSIEISFIASPASQPDMQGEGQYRLLAIKKGLSAMSATANCAGQSNALKQTIRYRHLQFKCPLTAVKFTINIMTFTSNKNERIKRSFFEYLKGAKSFSKSSVRAHADALWKWQEFTGNDDFANYDKAKAVEFVDWIEKRISQTSSGKLSVVSRSNYIRRIKKFFEWLCGQPGYKGNILKSDVEYLRLSKKDAQAARIGTTRQKPTFEQAKAIIEAIEIKNEIDRRDRALICCAFITGMRIDALISLRMKSFDPQERKFDQNPADGVRTKNSKRIQSTFFPIGWDLPQRCVLEWHEYLGAEGFGPDDPFFPQTMSGFGESQFEYSKDSVSRSFWTSTGSPRKIFAKRCKDAGVPYFHPHSFRHLIVSVMDKLTLTEEQKKAISLNLGHANVGTTFGAYGYGNMTSDDAIKLVQKLGSALEENQDKLSLSKEEKTALLGLVKRIS